MIIFLSIYFINKTVYIDAIFPQCYNISLTLDNTVDAFSLCDDTLVIVCNKDSSMQKEIFLYHIETDIFESFNIVYDPNAMDDFILYDNSYVYVPLRNGKIKQYSTRGKLVNTYDNPVSEENSLIAQCAPLADIQK